MPEIKMRNELSRPIPLGTAVIDFRCDCGKKHLIEVATTGQTFRISVGREEPSQAGGTPLLQTPKTSTFRPRQVA